MWMEMISLIVLVSDNRASDRRTRAVKGSAYAENAVRVLCNEERWGPTWTRKHDARGNSVHAGDRGASRVAHGRRPRPSRRSVYREGPTYGRRREGFAGASKLSGATIFSRPKPRLWLEIPGNYRPPTRLSAPLSGSKPCRIARGTGETERECMEIFVFTQVRSQVRRQPPQTTSWYCLTNDGLASLKRCR